MNPILVALDVPTAEAAVRLAGDLRPHVGGYKIGLELLMGPGPTVTSALAEFELPVFVDAKLHDIPNTVGKAAEQLGRAGARWVTAHAAGGQAMLEAAVEGLAAGSGGREAGILAITVLTSLDEATLARTGTGGTPGRLTSKRAALAAASGTEGVICSVRELGVVAEVAPALRKVTPGIRPAGSSADDQVRTATPEEAIRRGADRLVIGRAITGAEDPVRAAEDIARSVIELAAEMQDISPE